MQNSYDMKLLMESHLSLDEVLNHAFAGNPIEGASKYFNKVTLFVREMVGQRAVTVSLIPIKHIDY